MPLKLKLNSIQFKILASSIVISISLIALISFLYHRQTAQIVYHSAVRENMVDAVSVTQSLETRLDLVLEEVEYLAQDARVLSMDKAAQEKIFRDFLSFHPLFSNIFVFDPNFYITQITELSGGDWKKHLLGRQFNKPSDFVFPYGTYAMKNKSSVFTGSHWDIQGWGLMFAAVSPIFDPAEKTYHPRGVVSAGLFVNSEFLKKFIKGYSIELDNLILLVDKDGFVVANSNTLLPKEQLKFSLSEHKKPISMPIPEHFQKYRLSNWEDELLGKPFVFTQAFLPPLELTLYFGRDREQVGHIVFEVFRSMLVIFVLASMVIIALVYFLGRSFLKPVVILIDSMGSVAAGDYSRTIENKRTDELGKANSAYNQMVSELRKAKMVEELWLGEGSPEKEDSPDSPSSSVD